MSRDFSLCLYFESKLDPQRLPNYFLASFSCRTSIVALSHFLYVSFSWCQTTLLILVFFPRKYSPSKYSRKIQQKRLVEHKVWRKWESRVDLKPVLRKNSFFNLKSRQKDVQFVQKMITHFLWKNQLISFVPLLLFIITNFERLKSMMLTRFWTFCHSHLCAFSVSCQYQQRHWVQFPGKLLVIVCYLSNVCKVLKLANSSILARRQNSPARSYSAWCTAWAKSTWIAAFP